MTSCFVDYILIAYCYKFSVNICFRKPTRGQLQWRGKKSAKISARFTWLRPKRFRRYFPKGIIESVRLFFYIPTLSGSQDLQDHQVIGCGLVTSKISFVMKNHLYSDVLFKKPRLPAFQNQLENFDLHVWQIFYSNNSKSSPCYLFQFNLFNTMLV